MIRETVERIRESLKSGRFTNEASVSQGAVLPLLQQLEWPVFDTSVVAPEFSVESRRVDYALCDATGRPKVFVEVKKVGQSDTGDRQLFEYAFHQGVPMAILTDGQEWSFYLPGEEGQYDDRRVYKLDLLERTPDESTERLRRYLQYQRVISGEALSAARGDYKDAARSRQIALTIPRAWNDLLSGADELLVELLADKVEDICGYKPNTETCAQFIQHKAITSQTNPNIGITVPRYSSTQPTRPIVSRPSSNQATGFTLRGQFHPARTAREVIYEILTRFAKEDPRFLERFASRKHGRKRRYIAQSRNDLYPGRPDLAKDHSVELIQGWWLGTNYNKRTIEQMVMLACEVANIQYGDDLVASL